MESMPAAEVVLAPDDGGKAFASPRPAVGVVTLNPSGGSVAAVFDVLNPDKPALWSSDP